MASPELRQLHLLTRQNFSIEPIEEKVGHWEDNHNPSVDLFLSRNHSLLQEPAATSKLLLSSSSEDLPELAVGSENPTNGDLESIIDRKSVIKSVVNREGMSDTQQSTVSSSGIRDYVDRHKVESDVAPNARSSALNLFKTHSGQTVLDFEAKEVSENLEKSVVCEELVHKFFCMKNGDFRKVKQRGEQTAGNVQLQVPHAGDVKYQSDVHLEYTRFHYDIGCSLDDNFKTRRFPVFNREYVCSTENMACPEGYNKMRIHVGHGGKISRYKAHCPIPWTVNEKSFLDHGHDMNDVTYVKECLQIVLAVVNSMEIGITFTYVSPNERALFTLSYQYCHLDEFLTCQRTTFAQAFLPDQQVTNAYLYELAFAPAYRHSITNILCHEIAHTLGMRHWNAAWMEAHEKSVQFPINSDNSRSVMGPWRDPAEIHFWEEDKTYLKMFYSKNEGETIGGYEIEDIILTL